MKSKQLSLLGNQKTVPNHKHTLNVVKNGKSVNMSISDIFDAHKYDTLDCVTYSASGPFINKYLSKFTNRIRIIIGIPEDRVQNSVYANIAHNFYKNIKDTILNKAPKLYNSLNQSAQHLWIDKRIQLFAPLAGPIHSKFYILSNSKTRDNRIIIGSANLSTQAFSNNVNQYEDILLIDNNQQYFDTYNHRFRNELLPTTISYSNDVIHEVRHALRHQKPKAKDKSNGRPIPVTMLSAKQTTSVMNHHLHELPAQLGHMTEIGILPIPVRDKTLGTLRASFDKVPTEKKQNRKQQIENKTVYKIAKDYVSPRSKLPKLASASTISKKISKDIVNLHVKERKAPKGVITHRDGNLFEFSAQRIYAKNTGLRAKDGKMFGHLASKNQIKQSLKALDDLLNNYRKYVPRYDDNYGKRIMEAFLYAFTAPFISDIEKKVSMSERKSIPEYLFIGGNRNSGKTNLIKLIRKSMGLYNNSTVLEFENIVDHQDARAKSKTIKYIRGCIDNRESTDVGWNVAPIFIDELNDYFFDAKRGGAMIKSTSNYHNDNLDISPFPALIGTTNASNYNTSSAAQIRSYYLTNDRIFDTGQAKKSNADLKKVYREMTSVLFQDFVVRLSNMLEDDRTTWNHYDDKTKRLDFLYNTRMIFHKYYQISGLSMPAYFPSHPCDDTEREGKSRWRRLYISHQFLFKTNPENDKQLYFNLNVLNNNKRFSHQDRLYRQSLPVRLMYGDQTKEMLLSLNKEAFLHWIGVNAEQLYKARLEADAKQQVENKKIHRKLWFKNLF